MLFSLPKTDASIQTASREASLLLGTFAAFVIFMMMVPVLSFTVPIATLVVSDWVWVLTFDTACDVTHVSRWPIRITTVFHKNFKAVALSVVKVCFSQPSLLEDSNAGM